MKKIISLILFVGFSLAESSFRFGGNASLFAEFDTIENQRNTRPTTIGRLGLNPYINYNGMTFGANIRLSNEGSKTRQSVDSYTFYFASPQITTGPKIPQFIRAVKKLEIGTTRMFFSENTLSAIPLRGGSTAIEIGALKFAFAGGQSKRAVEGSDTSSASFRQNILAGRIGIEGWDKSSVFFDALFGKDDKNSISSTMVPFYADSDSIVIDSIEYISPKENLVLGLNVNLPLFKRKLTIEGEIASSHTKNDLRTAVPEKSDGFAYAFKTIFALKDFSIDGHFKRVDVGYLSLGSPYLINDRQGFSAMVRKSFLDNRLALSAGFDRSDDNISKEKALITKTTALKFGVDIAPKNLPTLNLTYSPYTQTNDSLRFDESCHLVSGSSGYGFNVGSSRLFSSVNASFNTRGKSFRYLYLGANQSISFAFPLSLNFGVGSTSSETGDSTEKILSLDAGASYTFWKKWTNSISWRNSSADYGARNDYSISSSIAIARNARFEVRGLRSIFLAENPTETRPDRKEWRISANLNYNW